MLALKHRDRVHRIRLGIPVPNLQRIITALEDEFSYSRIPVYRASDRAEYKLDPS
jgi:hypothetical protein